MNRLKKPLGGFVCNLITLRSSRTSLSLRAKFSSKTSRKVIEWLAAAAQAVAPHQAAVELLLGELLRQEAQLAPLLVLLVLLVAASGRP